MYQYIFVRGRGKASFVLFLYLEIFGGGEKMKKNIFVVGITLLFTVMMVTPVLAGPLKVPEGKNKNINEMMRTETQVYLWTNPYGSFKEFSSNGYKWTLMRRNASQCSIGGALDASDWTFPDPDPAGPTPHPMSSAMAFMMLVNAESRWVYLNQAGAYNLLLAFFGDPVSAAFISSQFPEGVYFKADMIKVPD
jgi:hypothetical protein